METTASRQGNRSGRKPGSVRWRAGRIWSRWASWGLPVVMSGWGGVPGVLGQGAASTNAVAGVDPAKMRELAHFDPSELLEVKVTTASKYEQDTSHAPSSVTVLKGEEMRRAGYRSLAEALKSVRGMYMSSDRSYSYLGIRGFGRPSDYNGRILLMIDGHRVNEGIYSSALLGTEFPMDLELVERVEVVRGPGASLYGDNAFFGVINVITVSGAAAEHIEAGVAAGTWETYRGRFTAGGKVSDAVSLLVSGSFYDSAGEHSITFNDVPGANGQPVESIDMDADRYYHGLVKLTWNDFTLQGAYGMREKVYPAAPYGAVLNDDRSKSSDTRPYAELRYDKEIDGKWTVQARAYYDYYYYEVDYPMPDNTLPAGSAVDRDQATAEWVGFEGSVGLEVADRHRLVAGVEVRHNLRLDQRSFRVDPYEDYFDDHYSSTSVGAYAQAEVELRRNLWVNLGGRYDHLEGYDDRFNPRLAAVYQPFEKSTVKLLYGTAFRAPSIYESRYGGVGYVRDPSLAPEEIQTYELVFEQRLPWHLAFTSSLYHYRLDGLISSQTLPSGDETSVNMQDVSAYGVEVGLEWRGTSGAVARVSYCYQEAQDDETDQRLSNCPANLVQLGVQIPVWKQKVFACADAVWVDEVTTEDGKNVDAYGLLNLSVTARDFLGGLEASAGVYNAFGSDYATPVSPVNITSVMPQEGLSFLARLSYRF